LDKSSAINAISVGKASGVLISAHKGAERELYKDGNGGQGWGGFLKWGTRSMSVSSSLSIEHVQVAQIEKNMMTIDILISGESLRQKKTVETTTLLDTGAGGKFINQNFVQNQKKKTKRRQIFWWKN
jgi:hypothetical protein